MDGRRAERLSLSRRITFMLIQIVVTSVLVWAWVGLFILAAALFDTLSGERFRLICLVVALMYVAYAAFAVGFVGWDYSIPRPLNKLPAVRRYVLYFYGPYGSTTADRAQSGGLTSFGKMLFVAPQLLSVGLEFI